jgi:hypothetical protein
MCASLVSFGEFSFYFDHCSLWHTDRLSSDCFGAHMMGDVGVV